MSQLKLKLKSHALVAVGGVLFPLLGFGATCDVKTYGAHGDGRHVDTAQIQQAINDTRCDSVVLGNGVFLSGSLVLKSNFKLEIQPDAVLKGVLDNSSYPSTNPPVTNSELNGYARKALVYGESLHDVSISGGGTIDGSGTNPDWVHHESTRPSAILLVLSKSVTVENISVKDAGMWAVVIGESENVTLRGLKIRSFVGPNRDGIDIVDSHRVLIENSSVISGDDAICLKSGSDFGVKDVVVRNSSVLQTGSNALKLGSASRGYFKNITFENVDVKNTYKAAMALMSIDGGTISNIKFKKIRIENAGSAILTVLGRRRFSFGSAGKIDGVSFSNISGSIRGTWGSIITGSSGLFSESKISNLSLSDVKLRFTSASTKFASDWPEYSGEYPDPDIWGDGPAYGFYFRHIDGLKLSKVDLRAARGETRPPMVRVDAP